MTTKFSDMASAGPLLGTELVPILQSGDNAVTTVQDIADLATGGGGGATPAMQYEADTGSTADSDPGHGLIKWNHATQNLATILYLNDLTTDSVDMTPFWAALSAGGFAYLQHATDPDTWQIWDLTAVNDGSGYIKLTVALLADGGSFADNDPMLITLQQGAAPPATMDAADVVYDPTASGLTATDAQAAIDELATLITGGGGGASIGVQYVADTGSTADSDPGAGLLKWNHATQASASVLFLDDDTDDGATISSWWASLVAGGLCYLQHATDQDTWQIWEITGVTDASGYAKLAVTLRADGGSFADGDPMLVTLEQGAAGAGATPIGLHAVPVMAGHIQPSAAGGCQGVTNIASAANQPDIITLNFDPTTQEFAQCGLPMPKSWNEGTIEVAFIWSHAATTTNFGVVWSCQGVAVSDNEAINQAYGTAQQIADTGGTTNRLYTSGKTPAITIGNSPSAEDMVFFRFARVPADGSDTMAIDARLHGVIFYFTTDAGNDA